MAVVLCASFSMGFADHTSKNASTTATNHRSQIFRWKHSTWVNPWANAKRLAADNVLAEATSTAGRIPPTIARLTWSRGSADLKATAYYSWQWLTIPTGVVITFEFNISYNEFYGQLCWIYDETTGQELFASYAESQYFQWTLIPGHQYNVTVNY